MKELKLSNDQLLSYRAILENIRDLLYSIGQDTFINTLLSLLDKNIVDFYHTLNSNSMWGGAGAIWEVYFNDKLKSNRFRQEIVNLINLMEKTHFIESNGILIIRSAFYKTLSI